MVDDLLGRPYKCERLPAVRDASAYFDLGNKGNPLSKGCYRLRLPRIAERRLAA